MLSASLAKSSLEEMLESLRQKDECQQQQPRDIPPALPSRPNSRARLPSSRRSLPANFSVSSVTEDQNQNGSVASSRQPEPEGKPRKEKDLRVKRKSFGSKKMRRTGPSSESPYAAENEEDVKVAAAAAAAKFSPVEEQKPEWNDNVDYFIKKVGTYMILLSLGCPLFLNLSPRECSSQTQSQRLGLRDRSGMSL